MRRLVWMHRERKSDLQLRKAEERRDSERREEDEHDNGREVQRRRLHRGDEAERFGHDRYSRSPFLASCL